MPAPPRIPSRQGLFRLRPFGRPPSTARIMTNRVTSGSCIERPMSDTPSQPAQHADGGNDGTTRTAVVLPWEGSAGHQPRSADARLAEVVELAKSIGLEVVHSAVVPLRAQRPSTLLGQGQVASLREAIAQHSAELAVVDAALSPVQQRNL